MDNTPECRPTCITFHTKRDISGNSRRVHVVIGDLGTILDAAVDSGDGGRLLVQKHDAVSASLPDIEVTPATYRELSRLADDFTRRILFPNKD